MANPCFPNLFFLVGGEMKKFLGILFLCVGIGANVFAISPRDEDSNVRIHFSTYNVVASTTMILVDLSSSTTYNLDHNGFISISSIKLQADRLGCATGYARIGVVNFVNTSTGSVTYFYECSYGNFDSSATVNCDEYYSPSFLRTDVRENTYKDGETPYILSNSIDSASAKIQSDIVLRTFKEAYEYPAVGDLLLDISANGNAVSFIIDLIYHGKR